MQVRLGIGQNLVLNVWSDIVFSKGIKHWPVTVTFLLKLWTHCHIGVVGTLIIFITKKIGGKMYFTSLLIIVSVRGCLYGNSIDFKLLQFWGYQHVWLIELVVIDSCRIHYEQIILVEQIVLSYIINLKLQHSSLFSFVDKEH